jgi:hypothetical protein
MEITDSLKACENALRDLIAYILARKFGADWQKSCGLTPERIAKWEERRSTDEKKLGRSDPRIIYYSEFTDLGVILKKNWSHGFSEVFGSLREIEVFLDLLSAFRNPDAHRRELLPYERQLSAGISGKIRSSIALHFSKMETGESYYPRIESIQDSLGNSWSIGSRQTLSTGCVLRPGDHIQFTVSGTDPLGEQLEFAILPMAVPHEFEWKTSGVFAFTIGEKHVGRALWIHIAVRSRRQFHAMKALGLGSADDLVKFGYEVLPPRHVLERNQTKKV